MADKSIVSNSKLTALANAIRTKGGTSAQLTVDGMAQAVADIPTGGQVAPGYVVRGASRYTYTANPDSPYIGFANVTVQATEGRKVIRENGTYDVLNDVEAVVNVPSSGVDITDGIVVKARDANGRATSVDFYGETVNIQQFFNRTGSEGPWIALATVTFKNTVSAIKNFAFIYCGALANIDWSNIETIGQASFQNCTSLVSVSLPKLTSLAQNAFVACTGLKTFYAPLLTNCQNRSLGGCTSLETVQVGSVGHGVTAIGSLFLEQDTQSGLTITIYTTGSFADTAVANTRNGATNATIIIKASEATTYNGTSYAAGDTILTSEVV